MGQMLLQFCKEYKHVHGEIENRFNNIRFNHLGTKRSVVLVQTGVGIVPCDMRTQYGVFETTMGQKHGWLKHAGKRNSTTMPAIIHKTMIHYVNVCFVYLANAKPPKISTRV